jgi:2-polyprenyl-6-methoxyphenol hydroxylase-like FAD-dependent oxidoreductase
MRAHTSHYDAIVVGARVAGAATAMLLARAGLDVLVVDRAAAGSDTLSTHALMRTGVRQLTQWGLLPAVQAAGTPPVTRAVFDYGRDQHAVAIRESAGVSALYAPRRHVLDPILVDAAAAAGVTVRFGVSVAELRRDLTGRVCGVVARDRAGRQLVATAPVVIGADGLWSTVAEAVDAPVLATGRNASACWCTYVAGLPDEGYRWFYAPGAAAGYIPTNDGLTCVFAGGPADRFHVPPRDGRWDALLDAFTAAAPAAAEQLRAATPAEPVRGWPGVPSRRRRSHGPGWALVGDAGYYKDPLGIHGMSQALRDAELLAEAVVSAGDDPAALDTAMAGYEARRDALSAELFEATDALASYRWDVDQVTVLLRRLSAAMNAEVDATVDRTAPAAR